MPKRSLSMPRAAKLSLSCASAARRVDRRPHRAHRIVGPAHRRTEHRHDVVADVLVDDATLCHHAVDHVREVLVEQRDGLLRGELLG